MRAPTEQPLTKVNFTQNHFGAEFFTQTMELHPEAGHQPVTPPHPAQRHRQPAPGRTPRPGDVYPDAASTEAQAALGQRLHGTNVATAAAEALLPPPPSPLVDLQRSQVFIVRRWLPAEKGKANRGAPSQLAVLLAGAAARGRFQRRPTADNAAHRCQTRRQDAESSAVPLLPPAQTRSQPRVCILNVIRSADRDTVYYYYRTLCSCQRDANKQRPRLLQLLRPPGQTRARFPGAGAPISVIREPRGCEVSPQRRTDPPRLLVSRHI